MASGVLAGLGQVNLEGWATHLGRRVFLMWRWACESDPVADTPCSFWGFLVLELEQALDSCFFVFVLFCFKLRRAKCLPPKEDGKGRAESRVFELGKVG